MADEANISSPCCRNCCLNQDDVCVGCCRTLDEILAWHTMTEREKQATLLRCKERRHQMEQGHKKDTDNR